MMQALLNRVAGRVRLMVARVVVQAVKDATKLQALQVQVRAGEVRENAEHFQMYGYTSVPFPGAEGIGLAVGGSSDHLVVVCVDDRRYRLKGLAEGEVALYTDEGDSIILKRGNIIQVTAATKLEVISPLAHFTGDIAVDGRIDAQGDVTGEGTSLHGHTHMEQGDGSPVSPPL